MFVVALGDPFNGLTLYGPFTTEMEALEWAEAYSEAQEYNIVQVQPGRYP